MLKLNSTNSAYTRQKNQISNYQYLLDHRERKGILGEKNLLLLVDYAKAIVGPPQVMENTLK